MLKISALGLVAMLVCAAPAMAQSGEVGAWLGSPEQVAVGAPSSPTSKTQGWLVVNDVSPNPNGEARPQRVYGAQGSSSKSDGWVKVPAPVVEASSARLVINDVSPNPNGEARPARVYSSKTDGWVSVPTPVAQAESTRLVLTDVSLFRSGDIRLPRTYGFTRGASLPLWGALGDSVSTNIALHQANVVETNNLINTSPAGLVGLFALKAGMIYVLDQQAPNIRKPGLKITAGLWNGVILNNLFVAAGASNPVSIAAGIAYGVYMYNKESQILAEEEALALGIGEPMWGGVQ